MTNERVEIAVQFGVIPFAIANLLISKFHAAGSLGRLPFSVIEFFIAMSILGVLGCLASFAIWRKTALRSLAAWVSLFVFSGLVYFNLWWLYSAGAAV